MTNFDFLADDALVDTLLMEAADLLQNLIVHQQPGRIDLLSLPLSPACLASLEARLGKGEVATTLHAAGESEIHETAFPGVWWTRHCDESGRAVALLIEVADVPDILRASPIDMAHGHRRLIAATHFSLVK